MAKKKAVMAVPPSWGAQDKRFGETVKEGLDVLLGHRGRPLERAVTFQDLLDTNVLKLSGNISLSTVIDSPSSFEPVSDDTGVQQPPAPTSLVASGAFQNIILTWDLRNYVGHAFVEVFRHTSDSISDATLLARVSGFTGIFSDPVGTGASFYYWVRAVNILDDIGPFNSSIGVNGTTQPDVELILELLEEQITSSELALSLATPIGQIDTINALTTSLETYTGFIESYTGDNLVTRIGSIDTSVGTINTAIETINTSLGTLNTATSNLQTSLSDLSANTADVYISGTQPVGTANDPIADNSRWYDTSDNNTLHIYFDGDGDGDKEWVSIEDPRIGDNESAISTLNSTVFNADNSLKLATSTALGATNTTVTNINGTVSSLSSAVTSLQGVVFNSEDQVVVATTEALTALTNDVTAIYDGDGEPSLITTVQSSVTDLNAAVFDGNNVKLAETSVTDTLTSSVTTQGESIGTLQGQVTSLNAQVFDDESQLALATTSTVSGLTDRIEVNEDDIGTAQGQITTLNSAVFDGNGLKLAETSAVDTLTQEVEAIYNGTENPSLVKTIQTSVTDLNAAVFDGNNVKLAETSALDALTQEVEAIYDGEGNPSLVKTIQTSVTDLNAAVFDGNNIKLAETSAVDTLTQEVEAIYDGTENPSLVKTIQTSVTSLNAAVFDGNNVKLAETSVTDGISSTVETQGESIETIQGLVTSLNSAVFDEQDQVKLAEGSALETLTNQVSAIYDPESNNTVIGTVQGDITTLNGAIFDSSNQVKLASSTAVSALTNEVWGAGVNPTSATSSRIDVLNSSLFDNDTGLEAVGNAVDFVTTEVFPNGVANSSAITNLNAAVFDGGGNLKLASSSAVAVLNTEVFGPNSASASRIDALFTEVFDANGSRLATASALSTLNTEVNGDGAIADKVSNIAASMFVNGNTEGTLNLATASGLSTVTAEVFPNGTSNASSIDQISAAVFDGSGTVKLASADVVSTIQTEVFPNGTASASAVDTVQATVDDQTSSIETLQTVVGDENGGLSSQYTVKLDNAGHVSGFGLSNTVNNGTPTSAFIIRADRFAIVNPSASSQQTNSPGNTSSLIVPFVVQSNSTSINGETVPAGVYMDTAFIKNGSITNAFIGDAAIDNAKIANIDAGKINAGTISTSRLFIDNTTLTSNPNTGALQVNAIQANQITSGSISANVMSGTTVYADNLVGDVAVLLPFRSTQSIAFRGNTASGGGTKQVITQQLSSTTHQTNGHKPFASITGWYDSTANKTYRFQLYMQDLAGTATSLGTVTAVYFYLSIFRVYFSGNKTGVVSAGQTITAAGKTGTVTAVAYVSGNNSTYVQYNPGGTVFVVGDSVSVSGAGSYMLVGETRFKANTNLYAQFAVSGSLSNKTLGAVNMKLEVTRTGSSGIYDSDNSTATDYIHEVSGFIMGAR